MRNFDYIIAETINKFLSHSIYLKENSITHFNITNKDDLLKIVYNKENDNYVSKNGRKGFWLIKEAIEKCSAYADIGVPPWNIQWIGFSNGTETVGLMGYSLNKEIKGCTPNLHICEIQTLPTFHGLSSEYFNIAENIARKANKEYITLQCYEKTLQNQYSKFGFKTITVDYDGEKVEYMYKKI